MINLFGYELSFEGLTTLIASSSTWLIALLLFIKAYGKEFFDRNPLLKMTIAKMDGKLGYVVDASENILAVSKNLVDELEKVKDELKNTLEVIGLLSNAVNGVLEVQKLAYTPSDHINKQTILTTINKAQNHIESL